jgi:hypothetical protein
VEYNLGLVSSSVLLHYFFVLRSNILWYNNPRTSKERKYYEMEGISNKIKLIKCIAYEECHY